MSKEAEKRWECFNTLCAEMAGLASDILELEEECRADGFPRDRLVGLYDLSDSVFGAANIKRLLDALSAKTNQEAQPVGYIAEVSGNRVGVLRGLPLPDVGSLIYTAPPAPAVQDAIGVQEAKELFNYLMTEEELNATVNGYNACRADMLNGALIGEGSNKPVKQGYKLVPVEPTPKQWAAGVKAMDTGMDKVTLVYKAMLATAPTQGENQ